MKQEIGKVQSLSMCHGRLLLGELAQVGYFRVPQDLDPVRMEVLRIAGEGQSGLLDAGTVDPVGKPFPAGNQLEVQTVLLVLQEVLDGKADSVQ